MTCREFIEFLMEYSSGELADVQRAEFEEHIAECPECVAYLANYQQTVQLVKKAYDHPADRVPDEVPDDLVRAILASRAKRS